jgi:hypothetical protein
LAAAPDDIPDELKDAWNKLLDGGDARRLRRHLPSLQLSLALVKELESSLKDAFGGIRPDAVDPAKRSEARIALVASLESHSLSIGGVLKEFSHLSSEGQSAVRKILDWIVKHLVSDLTAFAAHLVLQSWSVAVEISSTPPGASFTFTLTFGEGSGGAA